MGCICSKESSNKDKVEEYEKEKELNKSSVQLVAPAVSAAEFDGSVPHLIKTTSHLIRGSNQTLPDDKTNHLNGTNSKHHRCMTTDGDGVERKPIMSRILSVPHSIGEHVDFGWPLWLSSVAAEAIKGWVPRRADSFEKLAQVSSNITSIYEALLFQNVYVVCGVDLA